MKVYRINMSFEDECLEDGIGWENSYLTHDETYTKNQLQEILNQAKKVSRDKYNEISLYYIEKIFIKLYGFKKLEVECSVDFHEED